ncbi:hypothetical protein EXIGLDRAFT_614000, partial [Exidia glandulosa HHB12029]
GKDFPEDFPMPPLETVRHTVEDTVHYQLFDEAAHAEWESVFPSGGGFAYLGPNKRKFSLAMFHSLHCLQQIREAITGLDDPLAPVTSPHSHVHHCLNYVRSLILCSPDLTLEPQSYYLHDQLHKQGVDGLGVTHTCRDWTQVYAALEENWAQYQIWLNGTTAYVPLLRVISCAHTRVVSGEDHTWALCIMGVC